MATKADKEMEAKLKARQNAKVRPDEPVEETRIYLNMPKKKAAKPAAKKPAAKKKGGKMPPELLERFKSKAGAKNAKAEEALDHVNDLSLMELHILAAAESQTKSGSHYWQDLYNVKRGDNPFLAISSNNLDDNKQPENPNQN